MPVGVWPAAGKWRKPLYSAQFRRKFRPSLPSFPFIPRPRRFFRLPSRLPRLHLVDLGGGKVESLMVAHGRGSDPDHTGWLRSFSNVPGSAATSEGDYLIGEDYIGEHGRSMRLEGLDPTNDKAAARAIVVHGAWYVSDEIVAHFGMLGRSEGCLAVSNPSLDMVLSTLGPGRMIYADKA